MGNADPMKKAMPNGPAISPVSLVYSTNVEESLPAPNPSRAQRPTRIRRFCFRLTRVVSLIVGPEEAHKPSGHVVLWNVLGFIVLLAFGCVAVAYPVRPILVIGGIVAYFVFFPLVVLTAIDLIYGMIKTSELL